MRMERTATSTLDGALEIRSIGVETVERSQQRP
jgi:hypothetical protein